MNGVAGCSTRAIVTPIRNSRCRACAPAQIVNAVIDRTFVTDGMRWVVDFKTSPHEGGDLDAFLDSEAQRYEAQLRRYAHLARGLGPSRCAPACIFPCSPRGAKWPSTS